MLHAWQLHHLSTELNFYCSPFWIGSYRSTESHSSCCTSKAIPAGRLFIVFTWICVVGSCTYTFTYGQKDVRFTVHIYTCMMGIIGGRKGSVGYSRYILCLTACYILQWYYLHASWYYYKHKGHASRERMCSARGNFFIFFGYTFGTSSFFSLFLNF